MAKQAVTEMDRRLLAGREYHAALKRLGFRPSAVFWAMVGGSDGPLELGIVSIWADNVGPKAVYDLLFEAWDACATPKEIHPFIVTLFSPESQAAIDLANGVRAARADASIRDPRGAMIVLGMMDYATTLPWVLHFAATKASRFDDQRTFRAFRENVHKLAA